MFAYCGNNPVNGCDPCGTCFHRWDFWNDCDDCGGRTLGEKFGEYAADLYDSHEKQNEWHRKVDEANFNAMRDSAAAIWDAYQKSYALEQEYIMHQAEMNIDMFDSPADIERSIDIIEGTVGASVAIYNLAIISTAANPPAGAVIGAVVGVVWAGRALYRALQ